LRPYSVIFFDLDHTLIDTKGQYQLAIPEVLQQLYGNHAPSDFYQRFVKNNNRLFRLYDERQLTIAELRHQRFFETWAEYGVVRRPEEADEFQDLYDKTMGHTLRAYEGTYPMLQQLGASHRIGIITNGSPDHMWHRMKIAKLDEFFSEQDVIVAQTIGPAKPHPAVYAAAVETYGATASECLMIGDNHPNDVEGARRAGLDAIWYVPDVTLFDSKGGLGAVTQAIGETAVTSPDDLIKRIAELETLARSPVREHF